MESEKNSTYSSASRTSECLTLPEIRAVIDTRSAAYREKAGHIQACLYCQRGIRTYVGMMMERIALQNTEESDDNLPEWEPAEIVTDRYESSVQYFVLEKMGHGGFGDVYLAGRRDKTGQEAFYALKRLRRAADPAGHKTLLNEVWFATDAGSHPNLIAFDRAFITKRDDILVVATRYASRGTLQEWMKAVQPAEKDWFYRCEIIQELLNGLAHLHGRSILHLDVKPQNIVFQGGPLLVASGVASTDPDPSLVCLIDYGLARYRPEIADQIAGSLSYMPPEALKAIADKALRERPIYTVAFDIYSVGVVLYELLAGRRPFDTSGLNSHSDHFVVESTLQRMLEEKIPPLPNHVPSEIATVVAKALARDPAERFESATVMARVLYEAMIAARIGQVRATRPDRWDSVACESYFVMYALGKCHELMPEHETRAPFMMSPMGIPAGNDSGISKEEVIRQDRRLTGWFLTEALTGQTPSAEVMEGRAATLPSTLSSEIAAWVTNLTSGAYSHLHDLSLGDDFLRVARTINLDTMIRPEAPKPVTPVSTVETITKSAAKTEMKRTPRTGTRKIAKTRGARNTVRKQARKPVFAGRNLFLPTAACVALTVALLFFWVQRGSGSAGYWQLETVSQRIFQQSFLALQPSPSAPTVEYNAATGTIGMASVAIPTLSIEKRSSNKNVSSMPKFSSYNTARQLAIQADQQFATDTELSNATLDRSIEFARDHLNAEELDRYYFHTGIVLRNRDTAKARILVAAIKNPVKRRKATNYVEVASRLNTPNLDLTSRLRSAAQFIRHLYDSDPEHARQMLYQLFLMASKITDDRERDRFIWEIACQNITTDRSESFRIARHIRSPERRQRFVEAVRRSSSKSTKGK